LVDLFELPQVVLPFYNPCSRIIVDAQAEMQMLHSFEMAVCIQ
jgi:hypothetical protein